MTGSLMHCLQQNAEDLSFEGAWRLECVCGIQGHDTDDDCANKNHPPQHMLAARQNPPGSS